MKVIIPTAGLGRRLRPHTFTVPKALLSVAGKPIIGHILDRVVEWGGSRVTVIIGNFGEQVEAYVRENYDLEADFRMQEQTLGLGHAVLTGLDPGDRELLVILGDTIIDTDMAPVVTRGVTSIGVREVEDPRKMGVVVVEEGQVKRLIEKPAEPPSKLVIVGIYYIRDGELLGKAIKETIERGITVKGEYQMTDALQIMLEWGEAIETFPIDGWYDCGRLETILATNRYLFDRNGPGEQGAEISEGMLIQPVAIGHGTSIERAVVGPYVSIGRNTVVRDACIRNSVIGDDVVIERALLEDTLIGNRAEVKGRFQKFNVGASSRVEP